MWTAIGDFIDVNGGGRVGSRAGGEWFVSGITSRRDMRAARFVLDGVYVAIDAGVKGMKPACHFSRRRC
eukprot:835315-Prorocentrum_minimum.AAC.2